jgi:hypothetical protein
MNEVHYSIEIFYKFDVRYFVSVADNHKAGKRGKWLMFSHFLVFPDTVPWCERSGGGRASVRRPTRNGSSPARTSSTVLIGTAIPALKIIGTRITHALRDE